MRMPRPRRSHRASPDEIRITRDGDYAIIAYADDAVATTHFKIGSEQLAQMTDEQIIDFWNDGIDARDRFMSTFGGWGFRLVFVSDTDIHDEPVIEVREPPPDE